jgi:DNA polymerase I
MAKKATSPASTSSTHRAALIIDGHNLLFACFCGMPDRIRSVSGAPIHAAYGFVGAVLRIIRRFTPRAVVVCFDAEEPNFRNVLAPSYKANRLPLADDKNPYSQLGDLKHALAWLDIPWLEIGGVEADDVIGTVARRLAKAHPVYIFSTDRDMYQLINNRTRVFSRVCGMDVEYGPNEILAKYKVRPAQFIDYKTLVGDTSDNIEGVRGIGPKTAARLLNAFGGISGILANLGALKPRIAIALRECQDRLVLNKQLVTIRTDVDNESVRRDFLYSARRDTSSVTARTVMRELRLMT